MTEAATLDAYGTLIEPATLKIQRLLPGPAERVWAYLTDSDLRRQWLAAGAMEMKVGAPFEFTWRNSDLSDPPGKRPEGMPEEHSMKATITECDPPHRLGITWGERGGSVSFELEPKGQRTLLTIIHRRLPERTDKLNVSAGWHAHLDALVARMNGQKVSSFWEHWSRLKQEYDRRLPA
jgi:uncharacterized protein YndB with AHSA1/START domain